MLDRDGDPFAYTVEASRVVADPTVVDDPERTALALTTLLDVPVAELDREAVARTAATSSSPPRSRRRPTDAIEALELPGVFFEDDPVRLYPAGAVGGQVVGFVGRDGAGLAGIEQTFEDELAGTAGDRAGSRWAAAATRSRRASTSPRRPTTAAPCTLTLDQDLQYVTEQRLGEACADGATTRASAVVLDVQTGEVRRDGLLPRLRPGRLLARPTPTCWATRSSPTSSSPAR